MSAPDTPRQNHLFAARPDESYSVVKKEFCRLLPDTMAR